MIKKYYQLAKPGIIYGNLIATAAGFFLAAKGSVSLPLLLATLFGTACIIGSACVFNNYIDRHIDAKMFRTKNRALVRGTISPQHALIYGTIVGIVGVGMLYLFVNILTAAIGSTGFIVYAVLYGIWKRRSPFGTIIGSIAGATPPLAGYCAVTNRIDTAGIILFLILVFWQMPHFYAIAIYRLADYTNAQIPVLPVVKGVHRTKIHMVIYLVGFIIATILLRVFGYAGYIYLFIAIVLSLFWLVMCLQGFKTRDDKQWAKKVFRFSLIVITILCIVMSIPGLV